MKEHLDIVLALILGLVAPSLLASTVGLFFANFLAKITFIEVRYIIPVVLTFCFVGSYCMRENIWDVLVTLIFGIFGYGMLRNGFSQVCLVIGVVLGVLAEKSFHQSLMMDYGSYKIFFTRPITLSLLIVLFLLIFLPFCKWKVITKGGQIWEMAS